MKQLKFDHVTALDIRKGIRTSTIRVDDKDITVGDVVEVIDKVEYDSPDTWVIFGTIRILSKQEFMIGQVPRQLLDIAEINSNSSELLLSFMKRFYGESITDKTIVTQFEFIFSEYDTPVTLHRGEDSADLNNIERVKMFADGGSRGNPGPSAYGFAIKNMENAVIAVGSKYLGITTNNQAEYHGLIAGMEWCLEHDINEVEVHLDSLLAINQMKGIYKVKNRDLWPLYETAKKISKEFRYISFTHVPRELNKEADAEVNKALDAIKSEDVVQ